MDLLLKVPLMNQGKHSSGVKLHIITYPCFCLGRASSQQCWFENRERGKSAGSLFLISEKQTLKTIMLEELTFLVEECL